MAVKKIPIGDLTVGMYVVELDRPWPKQSHTACKHLMLRLEDVASLQDLGVRHVIIDPTLGKDIAEASTRPGGLEDDADNLERELSTARKVRSEAITALEGVFEGIKTGTPINNEEVKQTVRSLMDTILRRHDPLLSLIHMQRYHKNMFEHAVNVCAFALMVGKHQGFHKAQLETLGMGAMLHDVGEIRLPRNLLDKTGSYTERERRLIQQHPRLGVTILSQSTEVHPDVLRIVLEHHERPDGSGYPAGLQGLEILPLSEIVSVVDFYDAMLSSRRERPPLTPSQAVKELYQQGLKGCMHKRWVEITIRCLGIYPVGSLVELDTGERGMVVEANPLDALRPLIKLVWNASQKPYSMPIIVNLAAQREDDPKRTIVRALNPAQEQ